MNVPANAFMSALESCDSIALRVVADDDGVDDAAVVVGADADVQLTLSDRRGEAVVALVAVVVAVPLVCAARFDGSTRPRCITASSSIRTGGAVVLEADVVVAVVEVVVAVVLAPITT